jgi:ubiquinone/menaquinone biosynthesis C-methylase UbiE
VGYTASVDHVDHVNLLKPASLRSGGIWADFGAGTGAFTLALRELVGPNAEIYAVDADGARLQDLKQEFEGRFGDSSRLHLMTADFSTRLAAPPLDGILMANSLHFFSQKVPLLKAVRTLLKPGGLLLVVEYNVDSGNLWVPYPLSFNTFQALVATAGFTAPRLLATHPSSFLQEFYSAMAHKAASAAK